MREIKFRGKTIDGGSWQYGNIVKTECEETYIFNRYFIPVVSCPSEAFIQVDPKTVGQFTGVCDANGKEIYDGDILMHQGIVQWNNEEHRWSVVDLDCNDKREVHDLGYLTSKLVIIGNIQDNH